MRIPLSPQLARLFLSKRNARSPATLCCFAPPPFAARQNEFSIFSPQHGFPTSSCVHLFNLIFPTFPFVFRFNLLHKLYAGRIKCERGSLGQRITSQNGVCGDDFESRLRSVSRQVSNVQRRNQSHPMHTWCEYDRLACRYRRFRYRAATGILFNVEFQWGVCPAVHACPGHRNR